ncbi:ABC transporter ATP-binding protein [Candidatus Peregrinibacteria bacterium]|nr:MAG: ABC transporter ATP-binding protein [Candidatus Peregrinibacteria bacterium]
MNAISIHQLKKVYPNGVEALKGVDLEVKKGDFFALLGANGAGKTTLIGGLTGLVNPSSGTLSIFDHNVVKEPNKAKMKVGLVPQEFNFNIFEKVEDILVTQGGYFGVPKVQAQKRAEVLMKALGLWEKRHQASRTLSGGMKRRLLIARALIHEPELLLLDEPTAGVDVELRRSMWDYLRELNKKGVTILLTTHYLEEAEQLCKNVAIIKKGEVVRHGSMKSVLHSLDESVYHIQVDQLRKLDLLKAYSVKEAEENGLEVTLKKEDTLTDLIEALSKAGMTALSIERKGNRLEQLFLNLMES